MRYTLRLLTAQQFIRAAAVIFACEAIRRGLINSPDKKSDLGRCRLYRTLVAATPLLTSGLTRMHRLRENPEKSSPKQLLSCPACQSRIDWRQDASDSPVHAYCLNGKCILVEQDALPVWTVDEDILYH